MAHDAVQAGRATYEDLLQVPDTMVAEIVGGELVVSPRPASPHALAAAEIAIDPGAAFLGREARSGPGGWWILPEAELHLADDVLVPDLAAWRCARMAVVPNVDCEGVAAVWLVDPLARTLESLRLESGRWTVAASHAGDEVARVAPFAELALRLSRWWLPE